MWWPRHQGRYRRRSALSQPPQRGGSALAGGYGGHWQHCPGAGAGEHPSAGPLYPDRHGVFFHAGCRPAAHLRLQDRPFPAPEEAGRRQTLLGVTGTGKTFTMANVIARCNRPTLVLATTRRWPRSCAPNSANSFPTTRWSTSSPTTTTTSRRPTSPAPTPISKRTRHQRRCGASAPLAPPRTSDAARRDRGRRPASCIYGWATPDRLRMVMLFLRAGQQMERDELLQARRHAVQAQRHRLRARHVPRPRRHGGHHGRYTRNWPSGWSSSATRSTASPSITRSPATSSTARTQCTSSPPATTSPPERMDRR